MKKSICVVCSIFVFILLFNISSYADLEEYINKNINEINRITDENDLSPDSIKNLSLNDVLDFIIDSVKNNFKNPFKIIVITYCVCVLCFLSGSLSPSENKLGIRIIFSFISVLSFGYFYDSIKLCLVACEKTVNLVNLEIPVFVSLLTVGGKPASGVVFSAGIYTFLQIVSVIVNKLFLPLITGLMCLTVACEYNIFSVKNSLVGYVKKTVVFLLSFSGVLFSGILSAKSVLASGSDGIIFKGAKFLLGSAVPVIGSAVSETFGTVTGALNIARNSFAIVFITAVFIINLSAVVNLVLWKLSFFICGYVCELFGLKTSLFESLSGICDIVIAVTVFVVSILTVSVGIVISVK